MSEKRSHLRDLEDEILRLGRENVELKASLERERRGDAPGDTLDPAEIIFRTLLDQAQHLAGILDLDGVLRYANKTSRDFIGKDPAHFIGKKFWETPWWAHSKETRRKLKTGILHAAKGEFVQFETKLSASDGSLRDLDFTLKPARDKHGRIFCLIPEAWDITDRKLAENALRENEEKYRSFIEATETGYVIIDENGTVLDANPTYVKMTGHDRLDEILNRSVVEWTLGHDRTKNSEAIKNCLEKGFTSGLEIDYVHKDGAVVSIEINSRVVETGSGRNILALCRDVTERRETRAELDRAHVLLDAVLGQSPVPTVVVGVPDLVVRHTNRAAADFLGIPDTSLYTGLSLPEVMAHRTWREFKPDGTPMDLWDIPLARALRGEYTHNEELILARGDGERRWELVNAAPIYDRAGGLMAGVVAFADITRRKMAEQALEKRIVALTQPLDDTSNIAFEDLFNLPDIQHLQDLFAKVWGVAALITRPDGTPITEQSNFTHFCADFVRKSPKGRANCAHSDSMIGTNPSGPNVQTCLSAGLCNAGASIIVGGRHIANWLIGQVRNETVDEKKLIEYARVVDADEAEFRDAFLTVPVMSSEQFQLVAETLFVMARQLSTVAYQNIQQARFITDLRRAEQALRESEERFRDLFENAPVGVFRTNSRGQALHVNTALARILGLNTPGEALERYRDLAANLYVHAERRADFLRLLKENGSVEAFEYEALRADGRRIWLSMDARILKGEHDDSFFIEGFTTDITDRIRAGQALRESEGKLKAVLQGAPIPQFFIDGDHKVVYWNKAIEEYSGIAAGDVLGTKDQWRAFYPSARPCLADLVLDGDIESIREWYGGKYRESKLIANAYEAEDFFPELGKGGMWLYFTASLISDVNGAVVGALETLEDITERKQAEQALRVKTEELDRYFTSSLDLLCIADTDGYFRRLNPEWERTLGYSLADLEGTRFLDLVHPDDMDSTLAAVIQLESQKSILSFENRYRCKDGSFRWIEWRSMPVGKIIYAAARDITERKQAEEALQDSRARLESLIRVAPAGIGLIQNRIMLEINQRICEMTGYAEEELVGRSARMLYPTQEEFEYMGGEITRQIQERGRGEVEVRWRRKDGSIIDVYIASAPLNPEDIARGAIHAVLDITGRKRAEEALRASGEFLDTVIENSPASMWVSDDRGTMLRMNQACRDLLHVTDGDLVGKYNIFKDTIVEEQGLMPQVRAVFERGETVRFVIHYDSAQFHFLKLGAPFSLILEVTISPVLDARKRVIHAIVQHMDITERTRAEEEVRHRHEFERLVTGISTRFINLEPADIDSAINDSLRLVGEFTGADRCLLFLFRQGTGIADSTHEWCADGIESHMGILQNIHGEKFSYVTQFLVRSEVAAVTRLSDIPPEYDAEMRAFEAAGVRSFMLVPIEFKKKVVGFLGLDAVRGEKTWPPDIAALLRIAGEVFAGAIERRQAETILLLSEERFKRLVQNSNDIIVVMDEKGIQTSLTGPTEKILGYTSEELVGTSGFDLIHSDDRESARKHFTDLVMYPNTPGRAEFRYRRKNGTWVTIEAVGNNLLKEPSINGIVLNVRDISERNKLQDQLQQAMKMEAVGRLAGGVAHDFNNLLTSIICNVEMAGQGISPSDPLLQNLSEVDKAAQSAATLTRQLLAFSRKQIIEPKVLNLNDLVGNIQKMLTRLIGEDISFRTVLSEGLGSVRIDAGQFEQVLVNLAVNARDAMPDGGSLVIETSNIELDAHYRANHPEVLPGKYVLLAVSDTGHGMSDEVKEHLFEPFFTTKAMGRGTGLGLATTFGAVKQAGGSIEVYSEIDQGTTFKVLLPRVEEPAGKLDQEAPRTERLDGDETILVVEDEPGVREMAVKILKRFGYNVLHAPNGGEAFMLVEKYTGHIDLLMTDVVMPVMNGRELAERLVKLHPEMKVLFTSGYTENVIVHHGVIDEKLNFIGKPYSLRGLARKIREVLGPGEKREA